MESNFWAEETIISPEILERLPPMLKFVVETKNRVVRQTAQQVQSAGQKQAQSAKKMDDDKYGEQ